VCRGYIEAVTKEHRSSNKETTKQIGYEDGENEEIRLGTGDSQNAPHRGRDILSAWWSGDWARVIIVPGGVTAVEGEQGDELHLVGKLNVQYSMFNV